MNTEESRTVEASSLYIAQLKSQAGNCSPEKKAATKDALKHFNVICQMIHLIYARGLSEWKRERGWLTDTCLDGQDTFVRLLDQLGINLLLAVLI